jgi:hypothetical protein
MMRNAAKAIVEYQGEILGFDHRVGHCGVFHCRASMNLYVPLGSSPEIGRIRPYKIGSPAHVEETGSMYNCGAPLL